MTFRAGDVVLHRPSGEKWTLACDEERAEVICCGWPESYAKAADCTLLRAATDEDRLVTLLLVAKGPRDHYRRGVAVQQLAREPHPLCSICVDTSCDPLGKATRRAGDVPLCDRHLADALDGARARLREAQSTVERLENAQPIAPEPST